MRTPEWAADSGFVVYELHVRESYLAQTCYTKKLFCCFIKSSQLRGFASKSTFYIILPNDPLLLPQIGQKKLKVHVTVKLRIPNTSSSLQKTLTCCSTILPVLKNVKWKSLEVLGKTIIRYVRSCYNTAPLIWMVGVRHLQTAWSFINLRVSMSMKNTTLTHSLGRFWPSKIKPSISFQMSATNHSVTRKQFPEERSPQLRCCISLKPRKPKGRCEN